MDTTFEISLHIKTLKGIETCGTFSLGSEEASVKTLYNSLEGDPEISAACSDHY